MNGFGCFNQGFLLFGVRIMSLGMRMKERERLRVIELFILYIYI